MVRPAMKRLVVLLLVLGGKLVIDADCGYGNSANAAPSPTTPRSPPPRARSMTVVIGCIPSSTALTLLVLPILYRWAHRRSDVRATPTFANASVGQP
jgi:hypothetical protein